MVMPEMQGIVGIMMSDSTTTTGNYLSFDATQPPPTAYAYSPSTQRVVEEEMERRMKVKFKEGYEKGLDEAEAEIRARRTKAMGKVPKHTVEYKARKMPVGVKASRMEGWNDAPPPVGIIESGLPKSDEFTQLYNHDFHKLLANFEALLEN